MKYYLLIQDHGRVVREQHSDSLTELVNIWLSLTNAERETYSLTIRTVGAR